MPLNPYQQEPDNRALLQAMGDHADQNSDQTLYDMISRLLESFVMVPIRATPKESFGEGDRKIYTVDEGDQVEVMEMTDPEGQRVLPLFTSWEEFRGKVTDPEYGAMVRPARQACAFAVAAQFLGGAVINPGARSGLILPQTMKSGILNAVAAGQLPPRPE